MQPARVVSGEACVRYYLHRSFLLCTVLKICAISLCEISGKTTKHYQLLAEVTAIDNQTALSSIRGRLTHINSGELGPRQE